MGHNDLLSTLTEPLARVVAVCDVDARRLAAGKTYAEDYYSGRGESGVSIRAFQDFRQLLEAPDIDAVVVSVPDHSHALVAIEAVLAGKHVYLQKPITYSIAEAIALRKAVEARKIILQTGSQQRSERPWGAFRKASEAVRNGRLGRLHTIRIGLGLDRASGQKPITSPVPDNLDYERWLGPAPEQPYIEGRVHPQNAVKGRPGWITTEDFGLGMITNWGAHHLDIAHWAMGQELGGPLTVSGRAKFPKDDLVTVHGEYHFDLCYPNHVRVLMDNTYSTGLRFEGEEGWIFCTRSDDSNGLAPLRASDPKLLTSLAADAVRWRPSKSHFGDWLESIVAQRAPIAPIQESTRSLEACCAAWISLKLKHQLTWDVTTERFTGRGSQAANPLLERAARKPEYDYQVALRRAGLA